MGIIPHPSINKEWLLILLNSIDLEKYQQGSPTPSVSQKTLEKIVFGLPPVSEQEVIAEIVNELLPLLDTLNSKYTELTDIKQLMCQRLAIDLEGGI